MSIPKMYNLKLRYVILTGLISLISFIEVGSQPLLAKVGNGLGESCVFYKTPLEFFNPGTGGSDCLWDFSELSIPKVQQKVMQRIYSLF